MWKAKLIEWFKYTNSTIRANNKLLPMATKLDKAAMLCFKEIVKTDKGQLILQLPNLSQFFFSSYTTSLHYHQAIVSASLSKYSLNNLVLIRPQLEAAIIFLYFIDSSNEEELFNKIERYHDWVVVKMYQNSCKSSKLHFVQHLSTHKSFVEQINKNYFVLTQKYASREKELNKLSNSSSFVLDKSFVARQNGIEELYLHIQSEASASIHIADVSDRASFIFTDEGISYTFDNHSDDSFWALLLSNLVQFHLIKATANYFGVYDSIKEHLKETIYNP